MSMHPGPWTYSNASGYIVDSRGETICDVSITPDPETRAVLLHALETHAALKKLHEHADGEERDQYEGPGGRIRREPQAIAEARSLLKKINAEIAKGKP